MTLITSYDRRTVVRRGRWLTWATLLYNSLEAVLSIGAGVAAGSVALVGFGIDSVIELAASSAGLWRLHADIEPLTRARTERQTVRFIGLCFVALALYVIYEAGQTLLARRAPQESVLGMAIATASLIVMPVLARAKRHVAFRLASGALAAEAKQTQICAYLSAILLAGLAFNAAIGWWWADPAAALAMAPLIAWEGIQALRGRTVCCDDAV